MKINRRHFIKSGAAVTAGAMVSPTIIPSHVIGENAPSNRITFGFIGMGPQGTNINLKSFLGQKEVKVVAVCDAFLNKAKNAKAIVDEAYGNQDCRAYQDFRNIIQDPSIDVVVISTPDHWHVPMSLMALEAGKDVFCEKPTLSIEEGQRLTKAFAKSDRIFQTGLEDRSLIHFHRMVEWVKNGAIGDLEQVEVRMPAGVANDIEEPVKPPADLDWNLWQGPAEYHPYTRRITGGFYWRYIDRYSKGPILDMGTHLVDTAQIGVNDPLVCPVEVSGTGEIPVGSLSDVPIKYDLKYRYSNGVEMTVKNGPKGYWDPDGCFLEFRGTRGWVRRDGWDSSLEASDPSILRLRYEADESKHWPHPQSEHLNFLSALKKRSPHTTYPAIDLHQMCTTLHMGVICIQLGRKLQWDPKKEAFLNDTVANQMRKGPEPRNWEAEA